MTYHPSYLEPRGPQNGAISTRVLTRARKALPTRSRKPASER
jgi:hypothetical protein